MCYSVFIPGCVRSLSCSKNQTWIHQSLWHIPVYVYAVQISQDVRSCRERGGQRLLNLILGWHHDIQWRTFRTLWTFVTGCPGTCCSWNQDTTLFQSKVEYLGHKISKGGVSIILEYVQKMKDWPVPKYGKEVARFLGLTGNYQTFIPQYSALTNRLNGIKKMKKFLWNKEIEQDFV